MAFSFLSSKFFLRSRAHSTALNLCWPIDVVFLDLDVLQRISSLTDLGGNSTGSRSNLGLGGLLGSLCLLLRGGVLGQLLGEGDEVRGTTCRGQKELLLVQR